MKFCKNLGIKVFSLFAITSILVACGGSSHKSSNNGSPILTPTGDDPQNLVQNTMDVPINKVFYRRLLV
ncbi:Uncharacterised protein [Rodentibacter pneumotropicus]|uniref:Uncharacterized protein n=1 Tax=Rodentibacter pneumotropicus TaxID=758 RepID=A0A448MMH2_9PAST|nr:Uncharacterised protein [Rodentibacter pneumotropicus]